MATKYSQSPPHSYPIQRIENPGAWQFIDMAELWRYRDLFLFMVWRDIRGRYAQSVLGIGWAVIQPIVSMIVFTVIFGNFVKVASQGVPYAIFNYTALVPWFFFANALQESTGSLITFRDMLSKIYFPRVIIPLAPILGKFIDFIIAMSLIFIMLIIFRIQPSFNIVFVPLLVIVLMLAAAGLGMWLTALAIQYRDVKYAMQFIIQIMMYASPVVYSVYEIPESIRLLYALNPMVGVIEGFRSALLNTGTMPWNLVAVGSLTSLLLFITGTLYFRRMERIFADVA
jgi:lipopolysaccharide transport system permease protein